MFLLGRSACVDRDVNGVICSITEVTQSIPLMFLLLLLHTTTALKILQIVPGFTNSHVLFNYRLAQTLRTEHEVHLWTQMEMAMLDTGNNKLPEGVTEYRIPVLFKDQLKVEGLKVFQSMMFSSGGPYDLWWTGQEFKSMRVEACEQMLSHDEEVYTRFRQQNFDLAIAHFHDLCPLAIARKMGIEKVVWVTHGTSLYDFASTALGIRSFPASVPHPLSAGGHILSFRDRLVNVLWHLSTLDFVNLPQNLLYEENTMYKNQFLKGRDPDLWDLASKVPSLLINGESLLDFPRPLPLSVRFMGELGKKDKSKKTELPPELEKIVAESKKGTIIFSLGTVSNTTNMPQEMIDAFVGAFALLPDYNILWRMELSIPASLPNLHLFKWLPQRDLMKHGKTRLLIAHGGYNSLLETAQAGVPAVLMPLFADQTINAKRAERFGIAAVLDKRNLTETIVYNAITQVLDDPRYSTNAQKLSAMLLDRPSEGHSVLSYTIRLSTKNPVYLSIRGKYLSFLSFYSFDVLALIVFPFLYFLL